MNLDAIRAIDIHVHIQVDGHGQFGATDEQREGMDRYFGTSDPALSITPDRWLVDFERLDLPEDVRGLILKENAVRLLELDTLTS